MLRRMNALLWSRKEMILANKMVFFNYLLPIVMVILYQYMFKGAKDSGHMILFTILPMIPAFLGQILPTVVAEEAEKNNQRSLLLAGVKPLEYLLASLVIPCLVALVYILGLPLYLDVPFANLGWTYLPVVFLTTLTVLIIFVSLALLVDSQARATIIAMPVMLATMLLPILSTGDQTVAKIINFTYLGAFSKYTTDLTNYSLADSSFLFLMVWLLLSLVAVVWITRKKYVIK